MADTICKWCDREISEPDNEHPYWHDSDKFLAMTCSGTPNRRHEPAEPSTEGTQAFIRVHENDLQRIAATGNSLDGPDDGQNVAEAVCGIKDHECFESSVPQAAQPECNAVHPANEDTYCRRKKGHSGNHSAPCFVAHPSGASSIDWSAAPVAQPMSQAEWEARGEPAPVAQPFTEPLEKGWLGTVLKEIRQTADSFEVPAPVAQVDAGKYDFAKVRSQHFTEIAEEYEPAVAQTELPPIPDARLREMASGMDGLTPGDCADGKEIDAMVPELISLRERIASLTQRLQEQDAEIAKLQMGNVIDYKAACEQHAANFTAIQVSHDALLPAIKAVQDAAAEKL